MWYHVLFFCTATPPRRRDSEDSDEVPVLNFRPFGSAPKVFFKNVAIGERVSKTLLLRNPQTEALEVELLKLPPPDSGVEFSCKKWQINPHQETTLEIIWQPTKEGKSIHSIHLKTNTNARFFFSIVCVSISKKPLKKKGKISQVTSSNQRVILRSNQSFKKEQSIVKKTSLSRVSVSSKTKVLSKENIYCSSAKTDINLTKVSMSSKTSFKSEVGNTVPCEDDLKNCSSETYDVISPGRNLSLELNEAASASVSTFGSTKVHCVKKELNMFADMVLSPILPSQSFKPREGSARETYVLSTPLASVSEVDKISFLKPGLKVSTVEIDLSCDNSSFKDSSVFKDRIEHKMLNTPLSASSQINCNISSVKKEVPEFLNFNFSPIKENTEINISGISEIGERTNQHSYNKATLEISVPPFTPLQINKHSSGSAIAEKTLKNTDIMDISGISDIDGLLNQPPNCANTFEISLPPFTPLQVNKDGWVSSNHEKPFKNLDSDIDVSGISDIDELINQPPISTNTFEVSLPPFTPLEINKHSEISSNAGKTSKNCRNLKADFSIERIKKAEMLTPRISAHNFEITPLVSKGFSRDDPSRILRSENLQEPIERTEVVADCPNKFVQPNVIDDSIEFKTCDLYSSSTKRVRGSDSTQVMPLKKKSEMPVSSFVQLAPSSIETNYLMFSPPQRIPSSRKENIPPQIKNSTTFRKPLNENVPLSVNKASSREPKTTQVRKVKKDITHAIPKLILSAKKRTVEKTVTLMDTEKILAEHANPSYCITATNVNPFINSAVFCDQRWFDEREKEFVRWLNVLLTPPEQLNSSDELPKVDVADLWKKSCNSELSLAPSRETVSSRYLVNHRLDSVRRKACAMFRLPCVAQVLSKVIVQIEKGILSVRKDRNIVRDISLKTTAVELLLCYNPLWLRIGLEAIMGRTIPLESNSDRVGLIGFIARNILSDPYLVERYAYTGVTNMFKPGFEEAMKKHILKKFLLLVFFLDYAKENKLIFHNPCLFCKNAQYKESRDLLLAFARELLSGIGDITKHLRNLGYIVKHKQTYLDEFNYAVRHLGSDLRDGIRLTKVTEIILQESLSTSLRTPAISKLQKMHNVKLALTALSKAGHVVEGDITAKDIVEGHREKTMSLLWQIIYKFQLSRFVSAANTIQNWYRSLHICISRRIWIRKDATRRKVIEDRASIMIQKHWRGYIARKQYKVSISSVYKIQKWYKSLMMVREQQREYLKMRSAVIKIQKRFRDKFYKKKLVVVLKIQRWYRACLAMKKQRLLYTSQQTAARKIQIFYRSRKMIQQHQKVFKEKRNAVLKIQQWYRACKAMRVQRMVYMKQLSAAQTIQLYFRNRKKMQEHQKAFIEKRIAIIKIQQWYRACLSMRDQRLMYIKQQIAVQKIQVFYRSGKLMQKLRKAFKQKRDAVLKIQQWFRACLAMREQRTWYIQQRTAAQKIQAFYRRWKLMQQHCQTFQKKRNAVLKIQQWYRACVAMRIQRSMYVKQRIAVQKIQLYFRSRKLMQEHKLALKEKRDAVIKIQQWHRACSAMRKQRVQYVELRTAARRIQTYYRSRKIMKEHQEAFNEKRIAILKIQQWYRACLAMREERIRYIRYQMSAQKIQAYYRSIKLMQQYRKTFKVKRDAILKIQQWYRACLAMKKQRIMYVKQRTAVQKIQMYYRRRKVIQGHRKAFKEKRDAVVKIQTWYHYAMLMKQEREHYLKLHSSTIKIQTWFRATMLMRKQRSLYLRQRNAVIIIQQRYKALCLRRKMEFEHHLKEMSALKIQRWFRNVLIQRQLRLQFLELRKERETKRIHSIAAVKIQAWYRTCVIERKRVESSRQGVILSSTNKSLHNKENLPIICEPREKAAVRLIEKWYYSILQKKEEAKRLEFEKQLEEQQQQAILRNYATKIQAWWRGIRVRKKVNISHVLPHIETSKYVLDERFSLRTVYSKALSSFQSSPSLSYTVLLNAGLLIESAVRLSPEICKEFLSSSHLDTVILLLGAMNRSLPAENLICVLLKTLTHVLRHPFGNQRVLENERTIPCLVDLTGIWCTKRTEETFCHVCTVWWLLAQDCNTAQGLLQQLQ
ncbi:Protein abnormal spindle, partial [Gryllus bimaculatus]